MPFAVVQGEALSVMPKDLYIPPRALEIILEAFEGPLDLLLYLIKRQNLDILDIDVAAITYQYLSYIQIMREIQLELAADYLVMAAMLAEIKTQMLLPQHSTELDEDEDPRLELIERLQEYERFKKAAEDIDELPRIGRDTHQASAEVTYRDMQKSYPEVNINELLVAFNGVLKRAEMFTSHQVSPESLSVRERMSGILDKLLGKKFVRFESLFMVNEGKAGVVVTFLALMELIKESLIDVVQTDPFDSIHLVAKKS
ncbi:MAG: segregation/condensation protein A [Cellvibrionales bacterium TMED148]|nr:segregation/condensation protein A [Porticoccaceae bacterium]RPG92513.1 MAG: segregation/condensation protein A [Cellvibrionales bacterium TMED148]